MALLEMFGFDNAMDNRMDSTFDAVTDRAAPGDADEGVYFADGLAGIDYARVPLSTGFRARIALVEFAPADEIIMSLDLRPMDNPLGGANMLWGSDFLEAGVVTGALPAPGAALTAANYDRRVIVFLNSTTGAIEFWRGRSGANFDWLWWGGAVPSVFLGTTAPGVVTPGEAWAHYDFRFNLATDTIEVVKNGTQIYSQTGVGMGGGQFTAAGYSRNQLSTVAAPMIDNWHVISTAGGAVTAAVGNGRVASYLPTGDAGPNQWTPSGVGSNYEMVDDVRYAPPPPQLDIYDQDGTYVESAVANERELYSFNPTAIPGANIYGVQFYAYFRAAGGADASVNLVARSPEGAVFVYGPYTIPTGYSEPGDGATTYLGVRSPVLELDPFTGLSWTDARLPLWNFGFENVSGAQVRATQIFISKLVGTPAAPAGAGAAPAVGVGGKAVSYKAACSAPPTVWDRCMYERAEVMAEINRRAVCDVCPPPWADPPEEARRFQKVGSIPLPGVEGSDFLVLQMDVESGYDGVITTITNYFTAGGYVNGSGDLIWRLMVDNQWVKDLDAIDIAVGRPSLPMQITGAGYRIQSHQKIRYFVQLGPGSLARLDPAGNIVCGLFGWLYPRAGQKR